MWRCGWGLWHGVHAIDKYLLSAYNVTDTVPGAEETAVYKTEETPALMESSF